MKKVNKPKSPQKADIEKFLHRIDINLSYIYYGTKKDYTHKDVLNWVKNEMHSGELDCEYDDMLNIIPKVKIQSIGHKSQLKGFDIDYTPYTDDGGDLNGDTSLGELIDKLQLHISPEDMVKKLESLGYRVINDNK